MGGWFYIHAFGATSGVISTLIYSSRSNSKLNPNNRGSYGSSTLTFLGTFFLWVLFPSFNCYNPLH